MINQPAKKDHLAFIAELAASLRDAQSRPGASAEERGRCQRWLDHAESLKALLEMGRGPRGEVSSSYDDLPAALLKELNPRKADQLEKQIIAVLAACNGSADLDQVLVGLYRGFGVIGKRRVIQNKLWRLVRTGRIAKTKKRNVFSLQSGDRGERRKKLGVSRSQGRSPPGRRRKLQGSRE
jgi:hypothetical protein